VRRALVVDGSGVRVDVVLGTLAAAGFEALVVPSLDAARPLVETGAVAVVVGMGVGDGLAALNSWPAPVRRGCVVAVLSGEDAGGMGAFRLGVDVVLPAADEARLGEALATALATKRALVAPVDASAAARLSA
jgi:hypothetical protein